MTYSIATFLVCISLMIELLVYPQAIASIRRPVQNSLVVTAALSLLSAIIPSQMDSLTYLTEVLTILIIEIIYINVRYYRLQLDKNTNAVEKE